jgi:hypothetical protein
MTIRPEYSLHYGAQKRPLALVKPDERWGERGMFRIHWPDGEVSDMVNLSRARDAARLIVQRRHPECSQPTLFKWTVRRSRAEGSAMRQTGPGATTLPADAQNEPAGFLP